MKNHHLLVMDGGLGYFRPTGETLYVVQHVFICDFITKLSSACDIIGSEKADSGSSTKNSGTSKRREKRTTLNPSNNRARKRIVTDLADHRDNRDLNVRKINNNPFGTFGILSETNFSNTIT